MLELFIALINLIGQIKRDFILLNPPNNVGLHPPRGNISKNLVSLFIVRIQSHPSAQHLI